MNNTFRILIFFHLWFLAIILHGQTNVVVILADDLGYSDLGCFGGEPITPNIDKIAESGRKFTSCYASPICSPTRASLMTGCYPQRVGIPSVIGYNKVDGINPEEKLLPEMLKENGYSTALFGKWHLGSKEIFFPLKNGFDEFYGTLASNDTGFESDIDHRRYGQAGVCLFSGFDTVSINPNQWELTRQYTDRSIDFITRNQSNPFFLYLAYNAPHTPLFVSDDFAGKSKIDLYHDVVVEIDWSVGEIMKTLEKFNLIKNTLVIFLSDNGPWLIFGNHGGSANPFSGGKKQTFEGGVRVPCIMSLPGIIPKSTTCEELCTVMDFYPTIARLTDSKPTSKKIDGKDIMSLMTGNEKSPHEVYYYYYKNALQAVRSGDYKLQLPHPDAETPNPEYIGYDGHRGSVYTVQRDLALYNLKNDPEEETDISDEEPEIMQELLNWAEEARQELGDSIEGVEGSEVRSPGRAQ